MSEIGTISEKGAFTSTYSTYSMCKIIKKIKKNKIEIST